MRALVLAFGLVLSADAMSCTLPPDAPFTPYQELLRWAKTIVLARAEAVERKGGQVLFHFATARTIFGRPPQSFSIDVWIPEEVNVEEVALEHATTFNNHTDPAFWAHGGRTPIGTNCRATPLFEVGKTYLVFLDEPWHKSGFEKIESDDDLWLRVVELLAGS